MADDTRTRLIESALALLRAGGLEAVTLRAVGDASGLSRSAAYRHFTDKTALLAALAGRVVLDLSEQVSAAVGSTDDLPGRLRAFYQGYVDYAMRHPQEYRLVFASEFLAGSHPELEVAVDEVMDQLGLRVAGRPGAAKADLLALLCTAHGLAELATAGHLTHKGLDAADVIDAIVRNHQGR
ncbi:TetR family transcriptional regulator [Microtetraspora sp. NBRC 13810]|uniref:TetR/AcrR family transcriptional regulator n=1 Tax=Microtetraspora sp. NBRC 13810 TaxID=3030990 RepID=UPI0025559DD4|nr:TetR/AcrR family transcriptional regulator [Microtetraspora sp. NBRC 13810]GLW09010.1 TetR family transcriptional regulator [Microtetraspora sp. NBRC 13810]